MWQRTAHDRRHCGDWSFELRDDEIADLQYRGRDVLRSIRAVSRDADWTTAELLVDAVEESAAGLTLQVRSARPESSLQGSIAVTTQSDLFTVSMDLHATVAFETNRTGLVVLCPPQTAGTDLFVEHTDSTSETTQFPRAISPHQPVLDIAALRWARDGLRIDLRFAGDVFEMEDQRNWTDASFKIYNRPLSLPFPYPVPADEPIVQSVTVHVAAAFPAVTDDRADDGTIIDLTPAGPFPDIGIGAASAPDPAPVIERIGSPLLVELDLASTNWRAALHRASDGGALDVRLLLDPESPEALHEAVAALSDREIARVAAFPGLGPSRHVSDQETVDALRSALAARGMDIPVVGGSRAHFTELNRERHRLPDDLDGIVVTVTPLFHSRDTEQLVDSVAMQRLVAEQTVSGAGGAPVHIGPVCLRPRFNDVATAPQPGPTRTDLAQGYGAQFTGTDDPRQCADELAAWTIASAAALAVPGVASISWFEQWGPRGIRTATGASLAVEAAIIALADLAGAELLWNPHPDGLTWAVGARSPGSTTVLAANIAAEERSMVIRTPSGDVTTFLAGGAFTRLQL
ncbi:hypothetical protein [Microbacterium sp.]|uniref:hypothetical protein n=1 Tax=Microbacterium sp. TaxID=51671 RepID=UPI003F95E796